MYIHLVRGRFLVFETGKGRREEFMEANVIHKSVPVTFRDEMLKKVTMFLLSEAMLRNRYEECRLIVRLARSFGASRSEIKAVLKLKKRWNKKA